MAVGHGDVRVAPADDRGQQRRQAHLQQWQTFRVILGMFSHLTLYRVVQQNLKLKFFVCCLRDLFLFLVGHLSMSTEACKGIPACLKIAALVLPGNLAGPCTANQPISESLSSILTT